MTRAIYLDFNSTAPLSAVALAAMDACHREQYLNPASPHREGRRAKQRLELARENIINLLGGKTDSSNADRLILTSGGTEANNLALRSFAAQPPGRILVSAIEHPSIADTATRLSQEGFDVGRIPVDASGVVQTDQLETLLSKPTRCVSVMLGNNETGVLQPIAQIAGLCHEKSVPLHTDAVQAVGKIDVNFRELGVAAMTISAHKIHGPRGVGGLLLAPRHTVHPMMFGGGQQLASRPGTESVALAVGLEAALQESIGQLTETRLQMESLRDRLQAGLLANVPGCVVNGADSARLPHTLNVSFPGLDRQALLMALDQQGVYCSTGSACASGSQEPSPVLLAMGCDDSIVNGSLRISVGRSTTSEQIDDASQIICKTALKMSNS